VLVYKTPCTRYRTSMPHNTINGTGIMPQETLVLMLTVVMIFIIALLSPDATTAMLIIGLLMGIAFYLQKPRADTSNCGHSRKYVNIINRDVEPRYVTSAPRRVTSIDHDRYGMLYRGAIEVGEEHDMYGLDYDEYGHADRNVNDSTSYGNPFDRGRIHAPAAAGACPDDEANDDELDGDERITYQQRSRNDSTRVTAGTMNRRKMLDPYLRGEVEEEEDSPWWGRHEV
jgi:hypothetical protein